MEEKQLQSLVECVVAYFATLPHSDVNIGTPYLLEDDKHCVFDAFSGVIAISGNRNGWLRYSAPKIMVRHLLLSLGELDTGDENVKDLLGEVANTISGNLRKTFGSDFVISVPKIVSDKSLATRESANERHYVVPVYWRQYQSAMTVCLH